MSLFGVCLLLLLVTRTSTQCSCFERRKNWFCPIDLYLALALTHLRSHCHFCSTTNFTTSVVFFFFFRWNWEEKNYVAHDSEFFLVNIYINGITIPARKAFVRQCECVYFIGSKYLSYIWIHLVLRSELSFCTKLFCEHIHIHIRIFMIVIFNHSPAFNFSLFAWIGVWARVCVHFQFYVITAQFFFVVIFYRRWII